MTKKDVVVPYLSDLTVEENNLAQRFVNILFQSDDLEKKMTAYLILANKLNVFKLRSFLNNTVLLGTTKYRIRDLGEYNLMIEALKQYHYYLYDILVGFTKDVKGMSVYDKKHYAVYQTKFVFTPKENDLRHDEQVFRNYKATKSFYDAVNYAILIENHAFLEENKEEILEHSEYDWVFKEPNYQRVLEPTKKTS